MRSRRTCGPHAKPEVQMKPELLFPAQTELGECPVWDERRNCFFFMDVTERLLHRLDWASLSAARMDLPALGGGLVLGHDGTLVAGLQTGLYRVDPDQGSITF